MRTNGKRKRTRIETIEGTVIHMRLIMRRVLPLMLILATLPAAAQNLARIHGTITDKAGKPIRGAMISASNDFELVMRFSQADGRYEVKLAPGTYDLNVKAYGYAS